MTSICRPRAATDSTSIDSRLAAYAAAAGALGVTFATRVDASVIANTTVQSVGINGEASIDFNNDGQIDYKIDHDRVDLGGGNNVDYLQLDKNDVNGAGLGENLFAINGNATFPLNSTTANGTSDAGWVAVNTTDTNYPAALAIGTPIGPASPFITFQESNAYAGSKTIRANRLIDEDHGQIDTILGGLSPAQLQPATNGPNFLGLGGAVRYLGVKMNLNGTGKINYGWIGVQITSDDDATANVVGYGYETVPGTPIAAGAVPEPGTLAILMTGGAMLLGAIMGRRWWRR
jgi:hypothetical protein